MVVTFREHPGADPVSLKAWSKHLSASTPAAVKLNPLPDAVPQPVGAPNPTHDPADFTEPMCAEVPSPAPSPITASEAEVVETIVAFFKWVGSTDPSEAEPLGRTVSATEDVEAIEVPDDGPRQPAWKFFHDLESYLVRGDARERELAERMLEVLHEALNHIQATLETRQIEEAEEHMAFACKMSKTLVRSMSNLVAHRSKGVQYFTKISGPTVGMQAKIEHALNPAQNSPDARLVEKALHVGRLFYRIAEHARAQELVARDCETNDVDRRWATARGARAPEREDMKRWAKLVAMAHAAVAAFDKAAIDLARARRQVMIVEDGPAPLAAPARSEPRAIRVRRRAAA